MGVLHGHIIQYVWRRWDGQQRLKFASLLKKTWRVSRKPWRCFPLLSWGLVLKGLLEYQGDCWCQKQWVENGVGESSSEVWWHALCQSSQDSNAKNLSIGRSLLLALFGVLSVSIANDWSKALHIFVGVVLELDFTLNRASMANRAKPHWARAKLEGHDLLLELLIWLSCQRKQHPFLFNMRAVFASITLTIVTWWNFDLLLEALGCIKIVKNEVPYLAERAIAFIRHQSSILDYSPRQCRWVHLSILLRYIM